MKTSKRGTAVRKLLELCDDLQRIRANMGDPELRREACARLRQQSKRKTETLRRDLRTYRFRGPLGSIIREFKLGAEHFQVLSVLLQRHLRSEEPGLEGRAVLGNVFESSFDVLSAMELLQEDGALRASGLVELDDDEERPDDILEARFRLSDAALDAFRQEIAGLIPEDQRPVRLAGYRNNRELLVDLRILHNLYQLRSERVFNQDRWDRVHSGTRAPGRGTTRRIGSFWTRIRKRLAMTESAEQFPAVRFLREHSLCEPEMIIVVHLLFKELYEGNAYADAAQLLRLVSEEENDLIRNRRLLQPGAPLRVAEIVHSEPMLEGRELTAEVHLSDWAVNYLFGTPSAERDIDPDERLDWHLYLKNLEDTGTFFRDLEAN